MGLDNLSFFENTCLTNSNQNISTYIGADGASFEVEQFLQDDSLWNVEATLDQNGVTANYAYTKANNSVSIWANYDGNKCGLGAEYNYKAADNTNYSARVTANQKELKAIASVTHANWRVGGYASQGNGKKPEFGLSASVKF